MSHSRILGDSPAVKTLRNEIAIAARSEATILVSGESGTGKELVAASIHRQSRRADHAFVAFNIAALNEQVTESELFGHKKGSFTGAHRDHQGLFMKAHGGTILLDEIGDIPLSMQTKLLRVLQEREIWPMGSNEPVPIDVRVIVATHRDLPRMVAQGQFRQDLYYRLNNYPIQVPALRHRGDDMLLLFNHFVERYLEQEGRPRARPTTELLARVRGWPWPGNVRELQNLAYAVVLRSSGRQLKTGDIPPAFQKLLSTAAAPPSGPGSYGQDNALHPGPASTTPKPPGSGDAAGADMPRTIDAAGAEIPRPTSDASARSAPLAGETGLLDKQEILQHKLYKALQRCNGNRTEAARLLKISRSTLYRTLERMRPTADAETTARALAL